MTRCSASFWQCLMLAAPSVGVQHILDALQLASIHCGPPRRVSCCKKDLREEVCVTPSDALRSNLPVQYSLAGHLPVRVCCVWWSGLAAAGLCKVSFRHDNVQSKQGHFAQSAAKWMTHVILHEHHRLLDRQQPRAVHCMQVLDGNGL